MNTNKFISINDATIDIKEFSTLYEANITILNERSLLDEDFKANVEKICDKTKLSKRVVNKFIKARFKAKTEEAVKDGETFSVLDSALDG